MAILTVFAQAARRAGGQPRLPLELLLQDALRALAPHSLLVLLDARRPVANFGCEAGLAWVLGGVQARRTALSMHTRAPCRYEGGPSALIALPDEAVYEFDAGGVDLLDALRLLSSEVGGDAVRPLVDCRGAFCPAARPALPTGEPRWACKDISIKLHGHYAPRPFLCRALHWRRCHHLPATGVASQVS